MAYIIDKLGGYFQQGGCLYKSITGIHEHPGTCGHLIGLRNKLQKQASEKVDQSSFDSGIVIIISLLMELLIGDENILWHCVRM